MKKEFISVASLICHLAEANTFTNNWKAIRRSLQDSEEQEGITGGVI